MNLFSRIFKSIIQRDTPIIRKDTPIIRKDTPIIHADTPIIYTDTPISGKTYENSEESIIRHEHQYSIKDDWFSDITKSIKESTIELTPMQEQQEAIPFDENKLIELDSDVLSEEELLQIKDEDVAMDVMRMIMEML